MENVGPKVIKELIDRARIYDAQHVIVEH
jgi:HJR/Mrr/RecB family endonuclease